MSRHAHTFKYKKLTNGTRRYSPIRIKLWLWGFGFTYETKKSLGGFVIAHTPNLPDVKSDAFKRRYPKA
jgi:hypothetical protein